MHELELLDEFLKRPHQEPPRLTGKIGDADVTIAESGRSTFGSDR
jgi:hypothetical protein